MDKITENIVDIVLKNERDILFLQNQFAQLSAKVAQFEKHIDNYSYVIDAAIRDGQNSLKVAKYKDFVEHRFDEIRKTINRAGLRIDKLSLLMEDIRLSDTND